MKLTKPTNDQLSAAMAEHVAGWMWREERGGAWFIKSDDADPLKWVRVRGPNGGDIALDGGLQFATSADAVLLLLREKFGAWTVWFNGYTYHVSDSAFEYEHSQNSAKALTFPRAACIALLRAHGHEVED